MHGWNIIILWEFLQQFKVTWNLSFSSFSLQQTCWFSGHWEDCSTGGGRPALQLGWGPETGTEDEDLLMCLVSSSTLAALFSSQYILLGYMSPCRWLTFIIKDNNISCSQVIPPQNQNISLICGFGINYTFRFNSWRHCCSVIYVWEKETQET